MNQDIEIEEKHKNIIFCSFLKLYYFKELLFKYNIIVLYFYYYMILIIQELTNI